MSAKLWAAMKTKDSWLRALAGDDSVRQQVIACLDAVCAFPGVSQVMVFGSYAKGTQTAMSDLDVAVFLHAAADDNLLPAFRALTKICLKAPVEIQVQVFSETELLSPCGIVEEIVKFGVPYEKHT
ncbi:MAG: nucleotidyltransferase domain-containing protein [Clostridia bacterium]|nr:nucleotidyltransferase domain-containing protein [Clostridia bacterium]